MFILLTDADDPKLKAAVNTDHIVRFVIDTTKNEIEGHQTNNMMFLYKGDVGKIMDQLEAGGLAFKVTKKDTPDNLKKFS